MAIKILGNTIIDDDQNINSAGTAKFKVASANGVEVQTIGGNEGTKFPFVGKNTSGTTTFSVDGDGNVTANAFIGDGSNLTGISRITNNNQLTNGAGYITSSSLPTHTSHLTNDSGYITNADGGNAGLLDGYDSTAFARHNTNATFNKIEFNGVGSNSGNSAHNYAIYQESGAWSNPYPDLVIAYHTGIKIGAHPNYNGTRFYNDAPGHSSSMLMSVGDGDGNVRVTNTLYVGGNSVWHQGNDGSGSGLDADLLDGQQGSYYSNYNNLSNKPSIPTHTSDLTNNSGFLTSIPSTVVQYNAWGNVNISGIIQGKSFRCRAGENGAVQNTFNIEWSPGRHGRLWIGTTDVGQIYLSSDYRLKRNITPMSNGALDRIKMVNPVSYQWDDFERDGVELSTASEEINEGFIAHELQQIIPSAVDGEKDDPITIQSLKPDAIMAVAVKAIQELSAKNDALEARIAQLESN